MQPSRYRPEERPYPGKLSIVIPVFNEAACLPILRARLDQFSEQLRCEVEFLIVNDGSSDRSVDLLGEWAHQDRRVTVLNLARNFGHQSATTAGLDYATGDAVVIMDADLQDPPEVIFHMIEEYRRGYDVVYGRRLRRHGETVFKRCSAWLFYRIMRAAIHPDLPSDVGDFRLVSRRCLDAVTAMRETHRFLRGMVAWVGFPQTSVTYNRDSRAAGSTKYSLVRMLRLAWTAAISFSTLPLRISFLLGLLLAAIGMTQAVNALVRQVLGMYVVPGWTSLMIVTCLIGGANLICLGVLGEYLGRVFEESKRRPIYIIADTFHAAEQPVRERQAREDAALRGIV